jgi:hypothetical protein
MTYKVQLKRFLFWKSYVVTGHQVISQEDKLILYFADGSVLALKGYHNLSLKLGVDWVLFQKKQMEQESGQTISLTR